MMGWFSVKGKRTPVTPGGLRKYDHLPPAEAARLAWTTAGNVPEWDAACKDELRNLLPLLARALDRMEPAQKLGEPMVRRPAKTDLWQPPGICTICGAQVIDPEVHQEWHWNA